MTVINLICLSNFTTENHNFRGFFSRERGGGIDLLSLSYVIFVFNGATF